LDNWILKNRTTILSKRIKSDLARETNLTEKQIESLIKYQRRKIYIQEFIDKKF